MMTAKAEYRTERIDHLGIVSGICQEVGLAEIIDQQVGINDRQVSVGQAVQAMILNGLGFSSRPLYLTPEFFHNKPVDVLIGEGITADMLNDDSLGDALDRLYEAGVTELFARIAASACVHYQIENRFHHLDSSSFHLHGAYESDETGEQAITITHGYSRDQRPDLKQVVVSLVTTHEDAIPRWLEGLDGNSSDKSSFPATIRAYQQQLIAEEETYFVADSALYTRDNMVQLAAIRWVTRVPLTIASAKTLLIAGDKDAVTELAPGYWGCEYQVTYGSVPQRWLVVFSTAAYTRETKTFQRTLAREAIQAEAALAQLSRQTFACQPDAAQALVKATASWRYHRPLVTIEPVLGYNTPGRPPKGSQPTIQGYRITGSVAEEESLLEMMEKQRGKFIIATNQLDTTALSAATMLSVYKAQGLTVERGFRFLKDPMFFADSLFLKKPSRIMALLMVMGLSLLIYALAERKLRRALAANKQTIPDQRGSPTQRPTMRRVFQMFEGIDLLIIMVSGQVIGRQVLNLQPVHEQIVSLLGPAVKNIYIPPD
jgi:transposase